MTPSLYAQAYPHLRWLARRIAGPRWRRIGDDLIQSGAVALLQAPPYDPARGNVAGWVVGFAAGAMRDEARRGWFAGQARNVRRLRAAGVVLPIVESGAVDVDVREAAHPGFAAVDARDALAVGMASLTAKQREAVTEHYIGGVDFKQLGPRIGMTAEGVGYRAKCGVRRLRRVLAA